MNKSTHLLKKCKISSVVSSELLLDFNFENSIHNINNRSTIEVNIL